MAFINCNFFSEVLGISTSMCVILPQNTTTQIGMDNKSLFGQHKTLYLLHGYSDDNTIWARRTSIERYAAEKGLAIVMPNIAKSFCTDMATGEKYFTFVAEELPTLARSFFHLSDKREDNFIAGLSMGGYSAFKVALRCPDKYVAAASLSGVLDINASSIREFQDYKNVFGEGSVANDSKENLFHLVTELKKKAIQIPELYFCCGTQDFLYEGNKDFKKHLEDLNVKFTYFEESGDHEWGFWDRNIQKVLEWLPLK